MIYDCFSFFNELDLLEIRLNVLKDVVDRFVLVEATRTHTGSPKPLYYEENKARFAAFSDKIIHVVVDDFSAADGARTPREKAWSIENIQRNAIAKGLADARTDDTILISDLDEIPDPKSVRKAVGLPGVTRLGLMQCNYFLNFHNYTSPEWTLSTQALSYGTFCDPKTYAGFKYNEFVVRAVNGVPSASAIRFLRSDRTLHRAGWHFSYQGGVEMISRKIRSIAHTEFDTEQTHSVPWIEERIRNGEDVFMRGDRFFAEPLDERFPRYVVEHADRYAAMIFKVDDDYLARTAKIRKRVAVRGMMRRALIRCIPDALMPLAVGIRNSLLRIG